MGVAAAEKDYVVVLDMDINVLTATTPHVKQLVVKHAAAHTQPYPLSGGPGTASDGFSTSWRESHAVLIVTVRIRMATDRDDRPRLPREKTRQW